MHPVPCHHHHQGASMGGTLLRANSCLSSSERGSWPKTGRGRGPCISRDPQKCCCGLPLESGKPRTCPPPLTASLPLHGTAMDGIDSAKVSDLVTDRLTTSQWLKDTENHRSSAATYRQYSRLMSGTMSSSRQTTSRRTGRTIPRTPLTSYTCATRRFPSKTRRHYYNE